MRWIFKYILGAASMFCALVLLWVGMFYFQLGKPTGLGLLLHELVVFKQEALRAYPKPRVIIVGGSNVTYSFSAERLSDYTSDRVFNFGTHAGFNLNYLLGLTAAETRPGDTLILALEYQHYTYDGKNSAVQVDYICGYNPDYLQQMSWLERTRLIFSFNFFGLTEPSLSLLQRGLQRSRPDREIHRGREVSYLNSRGDAIHATLDRRRASDFENVLRGAPASLDFDGREASWTVLGDFLREQQARGIRIFNTWPVTREFEEYREPEALAQFERIRVFFARHGVPTLGEPDHFMFPAEDFFDTQYHLLQERQRVPTRILGNALVKALRADEM